MSKNTQASTLMSQMRVGELNQLIIQLIQHALPVRSAMELLNQIAAAWQGLVRSIPAHEQWPPVTLFVSLTHQGKLQGSLCDALEIRTGDAPAEKWSASDAVELAFALGLPQDLMSSMAVIPFEAPSKSSVTAGVLVFSNQSLAGTGELAQVCAGLVAQLNDSANSEELVSNQSTSYQPNSSVDEMSKSIALTPELELRLRDMKLAAMAEFAAGAGHEINNPLATITARSALLLKNETDPERCRMLEMIGAQAYRIRDMIGDTMTFARPPQPKCQPTNVVEIVEEVAAQIMRQIDPDLGISIRCDIESTSCLEHGDQNSITSIDCFIDPEQFRVVVSSLLRNSVEAVSDSGTIVVHLALRPGLLELAVEDSGNGLSDVEREHMFDPFFSGRQAGRGLGFGLSKCWQILRMHGGEIFVDGAHGDDSAGLRIVTRWPQQML